MPSHQDSAMLIAAGLPARDEDFDSDLISLYDIVVTGVEVPWQHFVVSEYGGNGLKAPFATLTPLPDAGEGQVAVLWPEVVRRAVEKYLTDRLNGGMPIEEARRLVDGSYTDAVVADSILQYAVYGKEIYG